MGNASATHEEAITIMAWKDNSKDIHDKKKTNSISQHARACIQELRCELTPTSLLTEFLLQFESIAIAADKHRTVANYV